MQSITIIALLVCVAALPVFANFENLRARRDVIEASGEGSGIESSGTEGSGVEGSGIESSGIESSGVEGSGIEGSGSSSGEVAVLEGSGVEGSGVAVQSNDSPKDVKTITENEFAVSA
ncbi:unnamed protein product [Caenorhabditis angaria]|uniref:Uncharacterized protein n=1 Tax=Caenorhabditis angaria TaxID=860376 RepID=A0A9P1MZE8_9PELO|nr:unnamed protein product [Caenorhabditis angaria]